MKNAAVDENPLSRIQWIMVGLAIAGAAGCFLWAGLRGAFSFLLGAAISAASFWSLRHLVNSLGGQTGSPSFVLLTFRLLLVFGAVYVILKAYEVFLPATISGLLLSVAAITLEALFQLFYARA